MKPDRDQTFMEIAEVMAKRSTCKRGNVGCVIVHDRRIIVSGYNGSPPGQPECIDVGCDELILYQWEGDRNDFREVHMGCQRTVHAEANAIAFAAYHGLKVRAGTMYATHGPCYHCAQLMGAAGIARVVYGIPYRKSEGLELLDAMGVVCDWYGQGSFQTPRP